MIEPKDYADSLNRAVIRHLGEEINRIVAEEADKAAESTRKRVALLGTELAAKIVSKTDWRTPFTGVVEFVIRMETR